MPRYLVTNNSKGDFAFATPQGTRTVFAGAKDVSVQSAKTFTRQRIEELEAIGLIIANPPRKKKSAKS